jgi:pyrroline-5-carboxylate reductase
MTVHAKHASAAPPELVADGQTLGVVGAGVMGCTLIRGLIDSGAIEPERIWASAKTAASCEKAAQSLGIPVEQDYHRRVASSGMILLCVKPRQAAGVLATLREAGLRPDTLLISIMAGATTELLESLLATDNPLVRAMPNTPCIVRAGMSVVCAGTHASAVHLARAQRVFEAVGQCVAVDESHFNAITALSGSGPAYQYLIMEALADAGVRVGLPRQLALKLVAQTVLGSAKMVQTTGRHPAELRDDVTTPAGCTIGGLMMLEDGKIRSVLARAVEEATQIAAQLAPPASTAPAHKPGASR